jgi:phosphohistidine swiveling domain-containing protein
MADLVVMLDALRAGDAPTVGAKAANLGELIAAGVPVPAGFVIPIAVYHDSVAAVMDATGPDDRRDAIARLDLPPALRAALAGAFTAIEPPGGQVAVRSSGTAEDSAGASFAGQYRTELAVTLGDLPAAVARCWASLWEPHAVAYRIRQGLDPDPGMAVVVQEMVDADAAGVAFTADPNAAPGDAGTDRVVIESSWGMGEAVVSGLVTPDRFVTDHRTGDLTHTTIADKTRMIGPAGPVDVPGHRRYAPSLTDAQIRQVSRLALAIEAHFGAPQDVEWAVISRGVTILQARPVTRLAAIRDAVWDSPVPGAWWARISICDTWLPAPLSTLFATTLFPTMVDRWTRNWAGARSSDRNPLLPRPMGGTINGYAYLRLDFELNRHPLWTLRLVAGWFRFHLARLERRWRTETRPAHEQCVATAAARDPRRLDDDELLALLDSVGESSARYWAMVGGLAWYWNASEWLLSAAWPWASRHRPGGYATLLQGYPTHTSDAETALYDLATDSTGTGFETFLDRYGHQVDNLDFAEPTPAEDPVAWRASLDRYRQGQAEDPRERLAGLAARRDAAEVDVFARLRRAPLRRWVLTGLLRWNRRYARVRDETLFAFTLGWPVLRRGYLELGRRLAAAGVLDTADDVFHLTGDELRAALRRPTDCTATVATRRAERDVQRRVRPPAQVPADIRIRMGPMDITSLALFGQESASAPEGLRGSPVSPGRITASACVVLSTTDFTKLRPGDVLVARHINPAWSGLLAVAGAVVTETGGALSHGSIVAREYGIPAVMGAAGATVSIQDGQLVTVDGDAGLVR